MSLSRVASLESLVVAPTEARFHRRSAASFGSIRPVKLTFSPVPRRRWGVAEETETVAAFEVPRWKRILQISAAVIYCLFGAGIIFGYAALKPILRSEGAYRDTCASDTSEGADVGMCVEMRLNFMFTVAAAASNVVALPVGALLDNYGPRACGILGSALIALGSLLMANASRLRFDGLLFGYLSLALGGTAIFIPSFQLSSAFPAHSGRILGFIMGAFDASSGLFLVYRVIYEWTGGAFGLDRFFRLYLVVPATILLLNILFFPGQSYKTVGELVAYVDTEQLPEPETRSRFLSHLNDNGGEHTPLLARDHPHRRGTVASEVQELLGPGSADAKARYQTKKNDTSGIWGAMHGATALRQIGSPWFVLISLFTIIQTTRINYFIATVRPQYEALLGSHAKVVAISNLFDVALPLLGTLAVPFIGPLLNNTRTVTVLTALVAAATAIGALGVVQSMWAAYANVALFALYRPFYYTAIPDLAAKVFGFRTFGTVYGTLITLSGAFNLSQYGLDYLFHVTFRGDPVPGNLMLLYVAAAVGVVLVGYVTWQMIGMKRKMLEDEAEAAFVSED